MLELMIDFWPTSKVIVLTSYDKENIIAEDKFDIDTDEKPPWKSILDSWPLHLYDKVNIHYHDGASTYE